MAEVKVGQPYNPAWSSVPAGMYVMNLSAERLEVLISFSHLTDEEVTRWRATPLEIGLASHQELVVLLARCEGSEGWMDAPFDLRVAPASERTPPPIGQTAVMWLLIEAETGLVRRIRYATLTRTFMAELSSRLETQLRTPFDRGRYDRLVEDYQARFQPEDLVRRAWVVEQAGIAEPQGVGPRVEVAQEIGDDLLDLIRIPEVREVVAEAIARGEAHLEERDSVVWYIDPGFGPEVPLDALSYDDELGMVDNRQD